MNSSFAVTSLLWLQGGKETMEYRIVFKQNGGIQFWDLVYASPFSLPVTLRCK